MATGGRLPSARGGSEAQFLEGVRFTGEFHMGESPVHAALNALVRRLDDLHIPFAIVGAMALNEYGHRRATVDIDVLITTEGSRASSTSGSAADTSSVSSGAAASATPTTECGSTS